MGTVCLLALMTGLAGWLGYAFAGWQGALIALAVAVVIEGWKLLTADGRALAMTGAREVTVADEPELVPLVHQIAARAGISPPRVYIADDVEEANALALGVSRASGAIVFTRGLLYGADLSDEEVAAVAAHEVAHIKNRDAVTNWATMVLFDMVLTIAAMLALVGVAIFRRGGSAMMIALAMVAIISGGLIRLAIGRSREYAADAAGATICGDPEWLIGALQKLARESREKVTPDQLALAPAMFIDPLPDTWWARLLRTHPTTEARIRRLERMKAKFR